MKKELKKSIIEFIFANEKEFQLNNIVIDKFKNYIFDEKGNYLIGGQDVSLFIYNSIKLINQ